MMKHFIYGLFYIKDDKKHFYYIGQTFNEIRRAAEHENNKRATYKRGSKDGTVAAGGLKKGKYGQAAQLAEYVYYRNQILPNGYEDGFEVLETVKEGELDITEAAVMSRMIMDGHKLMNVQQGEKWTRWLMLANRQVRTIADVKKSDAQDIDPADAIIVRIAKERKLKKLLLSYLKEPGWKKGVKVVEGKIIFNRGGEKGTYFLHEQKSDIRVTASNYKECYRLMAEQVGNIAKFYKNVLI